MECIDAIIQLLGFLAATTFTVLTLRKQGVSPWKPQQAQIYQTLELESIRLFRFEHDNPELYGTVWDNKKKSAPLDGREKWQLEAYLCPGFKSI